MAKVDRLEVEITADTSGLDKGLKEAVKKVGNSSDKMSSSFRGISGVLKGAEGAMIAFGAAAATAGAGILAFNSAMSKVTEVAGLKRMADRIGIGVEKFQELKFAAKSIGIEAETLADAIKDLGVKITDASLGAQAYEDALNAIGLESKNLVNLNPAEQFEAFADAIARSSTEMGNFAADEINDSMYQMVPLLRQGSEGIQRLSQKARDLGVVVSSSEMDNFKKLSMEFNELKAKTEALSTKLVNSLSPALQAIIQVANAATDAVSDLGKTAEKAFQEERANKIKDQQDKIASLTTELVSAQAKVADFGGIWDSIMGRGEAEKTVLELEVEAIERKLQSAKNKLEELKQAKESAGLSTGEDKSKSIGGESEDGPMVGVPNQGLLEAEIERSQEFWKTLEEAEAESYERRRILEAQFLADSIMKTQEAEKEKTEAKKREEEERQKQTQITMRKLGALMNSESRKMFEIGKAARIAEVAATTPKAAMDAYSAMASIPYVGPALGAAAAAAAVAYGAQQIQQIQSTQFRGGGGVGGGAGPAVPTASGEGAGGNGGGGSVQTTNVDVTLMGDNFSGDQIRGLIGQINDATSDNVKLNAVMAR